ncbi:TonB-dependent receptor [Neiella marina]|uniref:TonB-dependent receptor n=1 Tax=Neiella holothuriorum TaxID=2870530 RepID=A0ABS7EJ60_9GAMM|nr:TonB-dependent receptor [Neiella holothuriorum]MBW8191918.1 TonB-dependent receptor [Neiella holothuriorum]
MQFKLSKIAASVLSASTLTLVSAAYAADAQPEQPNEDVEIIQVKGIAGSLAESARQKRFSDQIVDAIVAEDIGKLPDNNIAEALQRITGVSIKSDFGVGEEVTIRGIDENRVELNGRSTSGTGRGGISLSDFPSSFLKTVSVVKSPTADMIEGALGGTVSMETIRPLELQETLIAVTLDAEYADKTENWAPKVTAALGSNWDLGDNGTFGASFVFSYLDREIRQDEFQTKMNSYTEIDGFDEVGNGPNDTFTVRSENTVRMKEETRERTAYGLSLQWAPESNEGNVYLDLSFSELSGDQQAHDVLGAITSPVANANTYQSSSGQLMEYTLTNNIVLNKTESDFAENDSYSHALGAEWQLTDQLRVSGEVAITGSDEDAIDSQLNLRPVDREDYEAAYALDPSVSPGSYFNRFSADVSYKSDKLPGIVFSDPDALTSVSDQAIREMFYDKTKTENDETAVRFDLEYSEPMGLDWVSTVKTGVRVTTREYEYNTAELQNDNGSTFKDAYKKAKYVGGDQDGEYVTPMWIDDPVWADAIHHVTYKNQFDQIDGYGANALTGPFAAYKASLLSNDAEGTFARMQQWLAGTDYATTGSLADNMTDLEDEWKEIEEDTRAVYLQFHLDFDEITAVVGARYIETDLDSTIIHSYSDEELQTILEQDKDLSVKGNKLTGTNEYSDFLPSLNVNWNVTDETIVRFAAAKVMRRADFGDLSPAFDIGMTLIDGTQGSYDLDPKRVTQYDLSVEHYFGDGGLVSAAVFYKDVESFTVPTTSCEANPRTVSDQSVGEEWKNICILDVAGESQSDVNIADPSMDNGEEYIEGLRDAGRTGITISRETNGGSGEVTGLELAYQQQFNFLPGAWSGLGVSTNYTYADSEQPNDLPLENISENAFNFQVYWEWEGFQTRLAYNWRDEYLDEEDYGKRTWQGGKEGYGSDFDRTDETADNYDPTAGNVYREARGQWDYSASYDINENWTVIGNIVNLTGEPLIYTTAQGHDFRNTEADRRYTVGVRAKF